MIEIRENTLTAGQFLQLYTSVGWDAPGIEQIEAAIAHSLCTFAVYDGDRLVGMARLLGDCAMTYYLKDLVVLPDCQGKGIGRSLLQHIDGYILRGLPAGWWVSVELLSAKGKEPFYEKFGFVRRPDDVLGCGMMKMIGKEAV